MSTADHYIGCRPLNTFIEDRLYEIAALCRRYHVRRLDLFGSAVSHAFDPGSSDLDFLVEFGPDHATQPFDDYFGLLESLEELFGRKIDLVVSKAMKNPYFIREVENSRQPIYGP